MQKTIVRLPGREGLWLPAQHVLTPFTLRDPTATGYDYAITVPSDEYWELDVVYAARDGGATLTLSALSVRDPANVQGIDVDTATAATAVSFGFNPPLKVSPGFSLGFAIPAYGAGDTYKSYLLGTIFKRL